MFYAHINNLIIILFFGALILLSFIFLTNTLRINKKGNRVFAIFLLLYASFWMEEIAAFSEFKAISPLFWVSIHALQILTPTSFYLAILYYSQPDFKIRKKTSVHFIIPVIYIFLQFLMYFNPETRQTLRVPTITIILIQGVLYSILSFFRIRKHQKNILQFSSNTRGINLNWLEYIIIQVIIICVIIVLHNIFVSTTDLNLFFNSINLVTVFLIAHFSLGQKEIFPGKESPIDEIIFVTDKAEKEKDSIKKNKVLSDEELAGFKNRLKQIMEVEKPFTDSELNLVKLSERMGVTSHQLSYIINTGFEENFFRFVNKYRVEKAKELLKETDNFQTMLGVAFDSGFNSKTSFNTTFKKITGFTPTEYKAKNTILN